MNSATLPTTFLVLALCSTALYATGTSVPSGPPRERIGVYDSRAVAYAHFWHPSQRAPRDQLLAAAREAKRTGDQTRFKELDRQLKRLQARSHLHVFSTAPADEAMAELAPRLPTLQEELGVTRFVSRWDGKTLRQLSGSEQVDVTDRLVRELLTPTARQQQTLDAMKTKPPLAPWKARLLLTFAGL